MEVLKEMLITIGLNTDTRDKYAKCKHQLSGTVKEAPYM